MKFINGLIMAIAATYSVSAFSAMERCDAHIFMERGQESITLVDWFVTGVGTTKITARNDARDTLLTCARGHWAARHELVGRGHLSNEHLPVECKGGYASGYTHNEVDIKSRIAAIGCNIWASDLAKGDIPVVSIRVKTWGGMGCGSRAQKRYYENLSTTYKITPSVCANGF
jgi:hypothetical protein